MRKREAGWGQGWGGRVEGGKEGVRIASGFLTGLLTSCALSSCTSALPSLPSPPTRISMTHGKVICFGILYHLRIYNRCVDRGYCVYAKVCKGMDSHLYRFIVFVSNSSVLCVTQQAVNPFLSKLLRPCRLKLLRGICQLSFLPSQTCHRN